MLERMPSTICAGHRVKLRIKKLRKSPWYDEDTGLASHTNVPSLTPTMIRELLKGSLYVRRYDAHDNTYMVDPSGLWVSAKYIKAVE